MPDDALPPDGNPSSPAAAGGGAPPPSPAVGADGDAGIQSPPPLAPIRADAPGGGEARPARPAGGPGKGNKWDFSGGKWKRVRKEPGELTPDAQRVLKSTGWGAAEPSAPAPAGGGGAPAVPVPAVFAFDEAGNRAFLAYALDTVEQQDKEMLREAALEILAGTPHEARADELADRFYDLSKARPDEREALVDVCLEFLRELQLNVPKSARGVWAAVNRIWRGKKVREEMRKELAALAGKAVKP